MMRSINGTAAIIHGVMETHNASLRGVKVDPLAHELAMLIDLLKYLPALTPSILIGAIVVGWKSRAKVQGFLENLIDNHVHTIVGELGRDISAQLINQTDHLSNKLDETTNKIVAAVIRPPQ